MYLKSLELYNYGPFKSTHKVDLDEGVIFITGEYAENNLKSNRAGKSSFVEAILYALFGDVRKGLKETDLIHYDEDEMYVKVTLLSNNEEITIKRGRTKANKPILEVTGLKGKKGEMDKELQALIGFSCQDFTFTHFFKQSDVHGFMDSTPAEKKTLLQTWMNLERWSDYEVEAKKQASLTSSKVTNLEARQASLQSNLEDFNNQLRIGKSIPTIEGEIKILEQELAASKQRTFDLKSKIEAVPDVSSIKTELASLESSNLAKVNQVGKITSDIEKWVKAKLLAEKHQVELAEVQTQLAASPSSDDIFKQCQELQSQLNKYSSELSSYNTLIREKEPLYKKACSFTGICPIDNQNCDKGSRIPDFKATLETEIKNLNASMGATQLSIADTRKSIETADRVYKLIKGKEENLKLLQAVPTPDSFVEQITNNQEILNTLQQEITIILENINSLKEKLNNLNVDERVRLQTALHTEQQAQNRLSLDIGNLNRAIGSITQLEASKQQTEVDLKALEVELAAAKRISLRWSYIINMFGRNGIPSILIENSLEYVEEFANLLLASISPGTTIEFATTKEVTSKDTHCSICGGHFGKNDKVCPSCGFGVRGNKLKDEINFNIYDKGEKLKFGSDSGGGKILISLALRLALSKLLSNRSTTCEFLVLDEIFGSLDAVNRDIVSQLVFNTLKNLMGFRQIFVITHTPLGSYKYKEVKVKRTGKISEIVA